MTPSLTLSERLKLIRERIQKAAEKTGRTENDVTLVAVGKTVSAERIRDIVALGVSHVGENKVQEALAKRPALCDGITHHFIGHLQSNKARKACELFDVIQTVDRPSLAEALNRISSEMGKKQCCFMEVKISQEESKSGIPLKDAEEFIRGFSQYAHLSLDGLMTIGPNNATVQETRDGFRSFVSMSQTVRHCFQKDPVLSFGMSDDFEMAIEEGSTMIRLGRALFGERIV